MYLPNYVARCADALDNNCQFRHNCQRWEYRTPRQGSEGYVVWSNFAKEHQTSGNPKCAYQIRID